MSRPVFSAKTRPRRGNKFTGRFISLAMSSFETGYSENINTNEESAKKFISLRIYAPCMFSFKNRLIGEKIKCNEEIDHPENLARWRGLVLEPVFWETPKL